MRRPAQGQRVKAGRRKPRDRRIRRARQHQRQRSRPEPACEPAGAVVEDRQRLGRLAVRDVHDERVEARATLGFEHRGDGAVVGRVGAQAVNGLGREGDKPAGADRPGGFLDSRLEGHDPPQAMNQGFEKRALP